MWSFFQSLCDRTFFTLATIALSSTCLWLATGMAIILWRRASAATKHRLWGLSMVAVLSSPILIPLVPLPRRTSRELPSLRNPVNDPKEWHATANVDEQLPADTDLESGNTNNVSQFVRSLFVIRPRSHDIVDPIVESGTTPKAESPVDQKPSAMADRASESRSMIDVGAAIVLTWLVGMLVSSLMLVISIRRVSLWLNCAFPLDSGREFHRCQILCQQFSIRRRVRMMVSTETLVPFVTGIIRPILVLPTGCGQWSGERLNVVLAHELMHVRRADVLWQMVARVCLIPVWFNPLGWLAIWRLRVECEHACDNAVLLNGEAACDYADHLVEISAWIRRCSKPLPHVVAMASHSPVERRVRSILDPALARHPAGRWRTTLAAFGMAILILLIAAITPSQSESMPPATSEIEKPKNKGEENVPAQVELAVGRPSKSVDPSFHLDRIAQPAHSETRFRIMIPSIERIESDLKWLIELSPTHNLKSEWPNLKNNVLDAFTQGLARTEPMSLDYVIYENQCCFESLLAVSDFEGRTTGFISNLNGLGYKVKPINRGILYEVNEKQKPPFFLRRLDSVYAMITGSRDVAVSATAPADEEFDSVLDSDRSLVIELSNDLEGLEARRDAFDRQYDSQNGMIDRSTDESRQAFELRKLTHSGLIDEFKRIAVEAKNLRVCWTTSEETKSGRGEFLLTALPETALLKSVEELATKPSLFANIPQAADPALSIRLNFALDHRRVQRWTDFFLSLKSLLKAENTQGARRIPARKEEFEKVVDLFSEMLTSSVQLGVVDAFVDAYTVGQEKNVIVCGVRSANGKAADEIIKLLPQTSSEWQVRPDLVKYRDISIHELTVPSSHLGSFQSLFVDKTVFYIGTTKDSVWGAAGVDALQHMKAAIDKAAQAGSQKVEPVIIGYQARLGTLTPFLKIIHQESATVIVSEAGTKPLKKPQQNPQQDFGLAIQAMSGAKAVLKGELKRTDAKIHGFIELDEAAMKVVGSLYSNWVKQSLE